MKRLDKDVVIVVLVVVLGIWLGILGGQVISASAAEFELIKPEGLKKLIDRENFILFGKDRV